MLRAETVAKTHPGSATDSERRPHHFPSGQPRGNSIYVTNLDGSNVTTLVTNQTTVHGIAIDVTAGRLTAQLVDRLGQGWAHAV